MKFFILGAIVVYQKFFSPDHSWLKSRHPYGFCRFYPSCSEYAFGTVEKFGAVYGSYLALLRIASCNPFGRPAYKPILNRFPKSQ